MQLLSGAVAADAASEEPTEEELAAAGLSNWDVLEAELKASATAREREEGGEPDASAKPVGADWFDSETVDDVKASEPEEARNSRSD